MSFTEYEKAKMKWEHYVKYRDLIGDRNLDNRLFGFSREDITRCAHEDEHLNNIPLSKWDGAASQFYSFPTTLCERVCMLKWWARHHIAKIPPPENPDAHR